IGKDVAVNGIVFKVIGICESDEWGETAYLPFTTSQQLFNKGWGVSSVNFTVTGLNDVEQNKTFTDGLRKQMAGLHQFDQRDEGAIYIRDSLTDYLQTLSIFNAINIFILFIAIGTLIAGIVGVSNIMLITVRERTQEFGIRKALGAKPVSILKLIFMESLLITGIFGYTGMVMGIFASETANYILENTEKTVTDFGMELTVFKDPIVDLNVAFGATLALVVAGVLAGLAPAYKAVRVTAIEAMRTE
ncbi:MAG: FtsX-like permease family protein, partial [Bacteroidales bacterium]|nr:FtsX-like permease family protein [Bacteroidales bacterium]